MQAEGRTRGGRAATDMVLTTFRANGVFLAAGDRLVAKEAMTAARWQVLGAVALAERPLTVAQIARRMGLARQSVHATVRRLVGDGLLELAPNVVQSASAIRAFRAGAPGRLLWAGAASAVVATVVLLPVYFIGANV